nr:MAG TPA: hypothetical protein [Caudoviricetes sp.]
MLTILYHAVRGLSILFSNFFDFYKIFRIYKF